jgi:hypothetical protein
VLQPSIVLLCPKFTKCYLVTVVTKHFSLTHALTTSVSGLYRFSWSLMLLPPVFKLQRHQGLATAHMITTSTTRQQFVQTSAQHPWVSQSANKLMSKFDNIINKYCKE